MSLYKMNVKFVGEGKIIVNNRLYLSAEIIRKKEKEDKEFVEKLRLNMGEVIKITRRLLDVNE